MMRLWAGHVTALAAVLSVVTLGGCASTPPTRFYVLTPLSEMENGSPAGVSRPGLAVGLRRVELPDYLDRPQIVTRTSPNKLHLAEFDRWGAPLRDAFARVLAEDLATLISAERVAVFPWPSASSMDYEVVVEVTRFEGALGGECSLIARWRIFGTGGREVLSMGKSSLSQAAGEDYEALVAAKSRLIADLSREIAAAIKTASQ